MASRVRLVDVARNAGVSPTTASLILSGSRADAFTSATQKKVHEAARSLGYTRSILGSSLKSGATRTICFFYTPPMDRFVERFQLHASARLEEENLHLVSIPVRIGEEQQIVNALSCGLYDSACLACNPSSAKVLMELLPTPPIPTMIFGTLPPNPSYIGVTIDETAGIAQALSGLVKGGAKKIAYLTQRRNPEELENEPRWHAYMEFLSDSQLGALKFWRTQRGAFPLLSNAPPRFSPVGKTSPMRCIAIPTELPLAQSLQRLNAESQSPMTSKSSAQAPPSMAATFTPHCPQLASTTKTWIARSPYCPHSAVKNRSRQR